MWQIYRMNQELDALVVSRPLAILKQKINYFFFCLKRNVQSKNRTKNWQFKKTLEKWPKVDYS